MLILGLVRRSVKEGTALPAEITAAQLADDKLLIPVLEDDALIFCLDELPEAGAARKGEGGAQVDELLQKNAQLQAEIEQLSKQFSNYRLTVEQTLDKRWGADEESEKKDGEKKAVDGEKKEGGREGWIDNSAYYFESYANNGESIPFS